MAQLDLTPPSRSGSPVGFPSHLSRRCNPGAFLAPTLGLSSASQRALPASVFSPMAESQSIETAPEATSVAQHVGRMSDRAIQRLVGGNAFLRGRIYARRNAVSDLNLEGMRASCNVLIKSDEPIAVNIELSAAELRSQCTCQAWRGPTGHCKHVAALLVALRDRARPPRPKPPEGPPPMRAEGVPVTTNGQHPRPTQASPSGGPVSVGGLGVGGLGAGGLGAGVSVVGVGGGVSCAPPPAFVVSVLVRFMSRVYAPAP